MKKACTECGYTKDLSEFYTQSANRDGKTTACKACIRISQRAAKAHSNLARMERERLAQEDADNPGTKVCSFCEERKPHEAYYANTCTNDGRATTCKVCEELLRRTRNKAPDIPRTLTKAAKAYNLFKYVWNECKKKRRVPGWADPVEIHKVYAAKQDAGEGFDVDHIIPLKGEVVSGLHVHYNLRVIDSTENRKKGNKLLPEYENG